MVFSSRNPYTGEFYAEYPLLDARSLEAALLRADLGRRHWAGLKPEARGPFLLKVAQLLREKRQSLAEIITQEMGKPLHQALVEVDKSAWVAEYFAEQAPLWLQPEAVAAEAPENWVLAQPLGLVLGIMPWNFPFWQVFRFAAPALMAGNALLLKHAPNVPRCALAIAALFEEAGLTEGVFQNLFISEAQVAELLALPQVNGVALTGSVRAGSAVGTLAGRHIKKLVLELGGSDAWIVLPDADLTESLRQGLASRLANNGQTCIAAKRFILHEAIAPAFLAGLYALLAEYQSLQDPLSPNCRLSCLARPDLADQLEAQIQRGLAAGAKVLYPGGRVAGTDGFLPLVLGELKPDNPIYYEELFGPVFVVHIVPTIQAAIALANDSPFGLGASVWTADKALARQIAENLEVGAVAINQSLRSDPRLPFGGIKQSGLGRELGKAGLLEFCNLKSIALF